MNHSGLYTPDCIRTFTGKYVNVFNPDPETICIEDIAHALSHQCRFGGHTNRFYSVAEHCVLASLKASPPLAFDCLMHDAAEAYLLDLPRPIKQKMMKYRILDDRLMTVIAEKFGFEFPLNDHVKQIDEMLLQTEWKELMVMPKDMEPAEPVLNCWDSETAKEEFLFCFEKIQRY